MLNEGSFLVYQEQWTCGVTFVWVPIFTRLLLVDKYFGGTIFDYVRVGLACGCPVLLRGGGK